MKPAPPAGPAFATTNGLDERIGALRPIFDAYHSSAPSVHLHEYSDANIAFHRAIINLSGSDLKSKTIENLFVHVRTIRRMTISQKIARPARLPITCDLNISAPVGYTPMQLPPAVLVGSYLVNGYDGQTPVDDVLVLQILRNTAW